MIKNSPALTNDLDKQSMDFACLKKEKSQLKKKHILLLAGGISSEREVSLESACCVRKALCELGYQVTFFDVMDNVENLVQIIKTVKPDCVFNALHGGWGENGCIQAFLNMMQIPYTHSGVLASALAMNKDKAKQIAKGLSIDVPNGVLVDSSFFETKEKTDTPCVIKPNQEGSSVGVYILNEGDIIPTEITEIKRQYLIEEYIQGRELSVAVMDDGPLGIIEIVPKNGFYDYEHKYKDGMTSHIEPTNLSLEVMDKLRHNAYKMHQALGCKGVSRSDFRYDEESGRVVFLELNANPGMTNLSLVPEMALQKGISYHKLVDILIEKADFER